MPEAIYSFGRYSFGRIVAVLRGREENLQGTDSRKDFSIK